MMSSFFSQSPVVLKSEENKAASLLDHQTLIPMWLRRLHHFLRRCCKYLLFDYLESKNSWIWVEFDNISEQINSSVVTEPELVGSIKCTSSRYQCSQRLSLRQLPCSSTGAGHILNLLVGVILFLGPNRGSVCLIAVVIENLFSCSNAFFCKNAHSVISWHHYHLQQVEAAVITQWPFMNEICTPVDFQKQNFLSRVFIYVEWSPPQTQNLGTANMTWEIDMYLGMTVWIGWMVCKL